MLFLPVNFNKHKHTNFLAGLKTRLFLTSVQPLQGTVKLHTIAILVRVAGEAHGFDRKPRPTKKPPREGGFFFACIFW
jgi:hypothetical protein